MASRIRCERCGFIVERKERIRSKHTNAYYCKDLHRCDRRRRGDVGLEDIFSLTEQLRSDVGKL